jgi:hypothetical protein
MRNVLLVAAVLLGACGKSRCEKYAEMEIRCGGYPASEEDITRKLAEGMCETTDTVDKSLAAPIEHEADCAVKFLNKDSADCAGYKQCKESGPQK